MPSYSKDPSEELDYSVDWSSWLLEGDAVSDVSWQVPDELSQPRTPTHDGAKATVWLAGGEVDQTYPVICSVTTGVGRKGERTFYVKVEQK